MNELIQAFLLGNSAILTNACMLPLYPGMIAFLSGNAQDERTPNRAAWLGALVLAGILSMMVAIGLILTVIGQSFGAVLPWLLPLVYAIVIGLGILMLVGINPFARLMMAQAPVVSNPYLTAYWYGLMFGPMTLPCTGPIITTTFLLSIDGSGAFSLGSLAGGLLYFIVFGLGFGWPLLVLPLLAKPIQRRFIGWMTKHHSLINRLTGFLLIGIGLFGIWSEVIPNWGA